MKKIKINVYKAFDGKLFEDEDECSDYEYELRQHSLVKNIKFYDLHDNLLNIEKAYDINDILYDIHKVVIPTEQDCNILNEWLEECFCYEPAEIYFPTKGTWYLIPVTTVTSFKIFSEDEMKE